MKSTRQDVVVLVLTILVSLSLIKGIVLLTSTVANADINDPFAQNLANIGLAQTILRASNDFGIRSKII